MFQLTCIDGPIACFGEHLLKSKVLAKMVADMGQYDLVSSFPKKIMNIIMIWLSDAPMMPFITVDEGCVLRHAVDFYDVPIPDAVLEQIAKNCVTDPLEWYWFRIDSTPAHIANFMLQHREKATFAIAADLLRNNLSSRLICCQMVNIFIGENFEFIPELLLRNTTHNNLIMIYSLPGAPQVTIREIWEHYVAENAWRINLDIWSYLYEYCGEFREAHDSPVSIFDEWYMNSMNVIYSGNNQLLLYTLEDWKFSRNPHGPDDKVAIVREEEWNYHWISQHPAITWENVFGHAANPTVPWDYYNLTANPAITRDAVFNDWLHQPVPIGDAVREEPDAF
jgi:hypothetical protein